MYLMQNDSTNELADILSFVRERAKTGRMTMAEVHTWIDIIMGHCTIWATVEELASFYGQSEHNVRCVINRKYLGKPKRRVYYSYNQFSKLVPQSWKCRKKSLEIEHDKSKNE